MQSEKAKKCLNWIRENYGINFCDGYELIDKVFTFIDCNPDNSSYETISHVTEYHHISNIDNNTSKTLGIDTNNTIINIKNSDKHKHSVWIKKSSIKNMDLKIGDAIIYTCYNNSDEYFAIIESFDTNKTFNIWVYVGEIYNDGEVCISSEFMPEFNYYRVATDDEIRKFIESMPASSKEMYFDKETYFFKKYLTRYLKYL